MSPVLPFTDAHWHRGLGRAAGGREAPGVAQRPIDARHADGRNCTRLFDRAGSARPARRFLLWPLSRRLGVFYHRLDQGRGWLDSHNPQRRGRRVSRDGRSDSYAGVGYPMMTVRRRAASLWPRTWARCLSKKISRVPSTVPGVLTAADRGMGSYAAPSGTSWPIDQTNPSSSRATAAVATTERLPRAIRRR